MGRNGWRKARNVKRRKIRVEFCFYEVSVRRRFYKERVVKLMEFIFFRELDEMDLNNFISYGESRGGWK